MMNKRLKDLIARLPAWPEEAQEQAVNSLLSIEREFAEPYELSEEDRAAIDRSLDDVRCDRFAGDEDVAAVFDRYRRA